MSIATLGLTSALAALSSTPPANVDPRTWESVVQALQEWHVSVLQALEYMTEPGSKVQGGSFICVLANTSYQLPDTPIPKGHLVRIKGLVTNLQDVRIASSDADAANPAHSYPLSANEPIDYRIDNLEHVWVLALGAGEGVAWTSVRI